MKNSYDNNVTELMPNNVSNSFNELQFTPLQFLSQNILFFSRNKYKHLLLNETKDTSFFAFEFSYKNNLETLKFKEVSEFHQKNVLLLVEDDLEPHYHFFGFFKVFHKF